MIRPTYVHTYIPTCLPTCLHTYMPTYMHTCTHACMHACSRTHTLHVKAIIQMKCMHSQQEPVMTSSFLVDNCCQGKAPWFLLSCLFDPLDDPAVHLLRLKEKVRKACGFRHYALSIQTNDAFGCALKTVSGRGERTALLFRSYAPLGLNL